MDLGQARTDYQNAAQSAVQAQSAQASLPDMLHDALTKKFSQNNPQVAARETALQNYLGATTQAPLDVTAQSAGGNAPVIYNPMQQADLIQKRRAASLAPLTTANYLLGLTTGGIQNVIDSTARAHQGLVDQLTGNANLKKGLYDMLFQEKQAQDARDAAIAQAQQKNTEIVEAGGKKLLIDKTTGEIIKDLGSSSSGSGGLGDISALLQLMGIGGNQEARPLHPQKVGTFSSGGQWYQTNDGWAPVVD